MQEDVLFAAAGVRLGGTITGPDGVLPVPGVVMISGSGPADRHNGGLFDALRDHLVDAGIAVLAYDKRGVGESTGAWAPAAVDDLAGDAAAAVEVLRRHPRVADHGVGVLGHSEGGWVALRLCARFGRPRYLIANSCPAVSFLEAEVFALNGGGVEARVAAQIYRQLRTAVHRGAAVTEGQQILASYEHEPWYAAALGDFLLDAETWTQLRLWADYDPYSDLIELHTPTLSIFGENDPLVPVAASVALYEQTATQAARVQHTVVLPGADHRIRTVNGRFADGYLTSLSRWCTADHPRPHPDHPHPDP